MMGNDGKAGNVNHSCSYAEPKTLAKKNLPKVLVNDYAADVTGMPHYLVKMVRFSAG